jgi:hypothetical protein
MFKTPEKKSASAGGGSGGVGTVASAQKGSGSRPAQFSRQHVEQIQQNLQNGAYTRAFRGDP